ncbi:MAG: hypothetical protein CL949_00445 [Erythrobacter sp.]|nr:hypothetical protein [Erythrobacter sp.]
MTNLILVTLGVLLASGAAVMVTFYGGTAFTDTRRNGEASKIIVEGSQIASAFDAFVQRERRLPGGGSSSEDALDELLAEDYLSEIPNGAGQSGWKIDYSAGMIYSVVGSASDEESMKICRSARAQIGLSNRDTVYRCDGSDYPGGSLPDREPCCIH